MDNSGDYFDLSIKIHRFFGLAFVGLYAKESWIQYSLQIIYQILVHTFIIALFVPCVTNNIICLWFRTHTSTANRQMYIHFLSRNLVCLMSGIVYCVRGKQFREFIISLRKTLLLIDPLADQRVNCFRTHRRLIYFLLMIIIISVSGISSTVYNLNYIKIPFYLFFITVMAEFYSTSLLLATDFYLCYFTFYIKIIQTAFGERLRQMAINPVKEIDIRLIRRQFMKIQSLIDNLSSVLSPMLLIICGSIFTDTMISFYFITKVIQAGILRNLWTFSAPFFGFTLLCSRLAFISIISDKINIENKKLINQVEDLDTFQGMKCEIMMISLQQALRTNAKCVTASGFFSLGKPLILSILGLTISYGVILIQSDGSTDVYSAMNGSEYKSIIS